MEQLVRFANDIGLSEAVRNGLMEFVRKPTRSKDVTYLAATRIAQDFIHDYWKELETLRVTGNTAKRSETPHI